MPIFKNRLGTRFIYLPLATIAFSVLTFPLPIQSANEKQDPTVTTKQIDALPTATSSGQPTTDRVALYQAMLDLASPWTIMCVAAHPDDEDGTSLIVMRHKYGAHTVSLFSTFGEGGQNAIGPELYEQMGAIRARETAAAAEIQGSEPHFLGLKDFGFSKTRDEAFRFWGHEEALRRMVLEIRKLRPDVIITNHSTTSNDHGQHQATALMVVEAFDAAADPNKFPEQLKNGLTTWQVRRLFVRIRGNQAPAANEQIVTIDPNERDSIRGVAFGEEALHALQQHATQGPWPTSFAEYASRFRAFAGQSGTAGQLPLIRYRLVRSAKDAEPLTPDAQSFSAGLVIPRELQPRLTPWKPEDAWIPLNERDQVLPRLLVLAKAFHQKNSPRDISSMPTVAMLNKKLDAAIAAAAGVTVTVAPEAKTLVPGTTANFDITVSNQGTEKLQLADVELLGMGSTSERPERSSTVSPGQSVKIVRPFSVPGNASLTVPHEQHLYDGKTFGEKFTANIAMVTGGQTFQVPATVAVDVTPKIEITSVKPSLVVMTPQNETNQPSLTIRLSNHDQTNARTSVALTVENVKGERVKANETPATIAAEEVREIEIKLPRLQTAAVRESVPVSLASAAGIPPANPANASSAKLILRTSDKSSNEVTIPLVYADAHVAPNLRVGYIRGFDFSLPNALNALGVESKELSVDDVKTADLSKYTSVIVDNRVYESKPELIAVNQKLLDYAQAGGTLIVFYHKSDEWNPDPRRNRPQLAPYKLILGGERITDENAPVTFLEPTHPLLNSPNKLNQDDFKNWIQERGLYYPREWDPQFHALLESNDPGENPLKGGLLIADYGKGHYIYTSMVWYRELRGGIPGAYRMLANMISYGR